MGAYGSPVASADEIRLWNWGALAGGAKGILYWQWKPEPSGLEAPGFGLTQLDGQPSERTKSAGDVAKRVLNEKHFLSTRPVLPINGIYVSRTSALFTFTAARGDSLYAEGLYGAYQEFFESGIPVCFIHGDQLENSYGEGLRTLYVPAALALSPVEQNNMSVFVSEGGTLIIEGCTGLFDHTGLIQPQTRLHGEIAGLKGQNVDSVDRIEIFWTGTAEPRLGFSGRYYRQTFNVRENDVEVLALFEDGEPAVCRRQVGEGTIVWIGTLSSAARQLASDVIEERPTTRWAKQSGYSEIESLRTPHNAFVRL